MGHSPWETRKATNGDLGQIVALVEQYWAFEDIAGFDSPRLSEVLAKAVNDRALCDILVASSGEKIVGYLIAVYVFSLEHMGLTAEIDEFFVLKEFRSTGVGSAMLEAVERCAVDAGCTNISLQISLSNARAREFYTRHGFGARSGYQLLEKDLPGA